MPSNGITISVTAETNAGGRRHMEDYIAVNLSPNDDLKEIPELKEQAFVGVFDGHGGKEAAKYAREALWQEIQKQPKFRSQDVESVSDAIKDAYLALHNEMVSYRPSWKRNKTGDLSTAGTTACTVIFRKDHIFVGNCGDSTAVMAVRNPAYGQPGEHPILAKVLTKDHKPDDPVEKEAIEELGGKVMMSPKGVWRVVWDRERVNTATGQKSVDHIPFLSVSRSLGDFWSFNPRTGKYVVSPAPDVFVHQMDLSQQVFVVLASDGLWNVMSPRDVVTFIYDYDKTQSLDVVTALIQEALSRWERKRLQADNISVLVAFLSEENTPVNSPCKKGNTSTAAACDTADTIEDLEPPRTPEVPASPPPTTNQSSSLRDFSSPGPSSPSSSRTPPKLSSSYCKEVWASGSTVQYEAKIKKHHHRRHKHHRSAEKTLTRRAIHRRRSASPVLESSTTSDSIADVSQSLPSLDQVLRSESIQASPPGWTSESVRTKRQHANSDEDVPLAKRPQRITEISHQALLALREQRLSTDSNSDSSSSGVGSDDMETASPSGIEGMPEHAPAANDIGSKNQLSEDVEMQDEGCCCD